jgi:hypothetical protein
MSKSPKANPRIVFVSVVGALVLAGLPFLNSTIRRKETEVANMRDSVLDAKDDARNARLRIRAFKE